MFGFPLLDVVIGLVFIYALLSLVCTAANEIYAGLSDRREDHLFEGISNLLGEQAATGAERQKVTFTPPGTTSGQGVVAAFYAHPLIKSLNEKKTRPSYIPEAVFARVLLDMFAPTGSTTAPVNKFGDFIKGVESALPADSDLRRTLLILAEDAGGDMEKLNASLITWFNDAMKRVTGWYKNQSQSSLLIISILVCLAMNADTISIFKELYSSPAKRNVIVAQAEQASKQFANYTGHSGAASVSGSAKSLTESLAKLESTGLALGWEGYVYKRVDSNNGQNFVNFILKLIGILFTALAATLGAPFWFDMLGKLINLRAIGKPPAEAGSTPVPPATTTTPPKPAAVPANPAAVNMDEKSVG